MASISSPKHSVTFYRNSTALMGKRPDGHVDKEYTVLKDETFAGTRTIVLQERDPEPFLEKVKSAADMIAERIGEGQSKTMRNLLVDVLTDYDEKSLDRVLRRLARGDKVSTREGCFKILVGDGRRRNCEEIMIRG